MRRLAAIALLIAAARAESVMAFETKRYKSPLGAHTLHVKATGDHKLAFDFGAGGKGVAPQLPLDVHVLDKRPAAVLFERYGEIGKGDTLSLLERDGRLAWRLPLKALFDAKTIAAFPASMSSIWWHRAWWVDEERRKVVVVAKGDLVREVDLETGAVAHVDRSSILDGVRLPHARADALELAAEWELREVRPLAEPLVGDASLHPAVRLRAAIAVQRAGGERAQLELFGLALDANPPPSARRYTLVQAARLLGKESIGFLHVAARRPEMAFDALRAMGELKDSAARALAGVIATGDTRPAERTLAVEILAKLPPEQVGKAISKELEDASADVAGALIRAGIRAGVEDLDRLVAANETALIRALDRGTAPVDWIADHFRKHPSTEAVQPLLNALRRHAGNSRLKGKLLGALRACTGLDYGSDPRAWFRALRR